MGPKDTVLDLLDQTISQKANPLKKKILCQMSMIGFMEAKYLYLDFSLDGQ